MADPDLSLKYKIQYMVKLHFHTFPAPFYLFSSEYDHDTSSVKVDEVLNIIDNVTNDMTSYKEKVYNSNRNALVILLN